MEKDNLIDNWLSQETSQAEREEMERIISLTQTLDVPSSTSRESAWDALLSKIEEDAQPEEPILIPQKRRSRTWIVWTASIAAALFVGYFTLINKSTTGGIVTFEAATGEMVAQTLPDQSQVTLNAASVIEYNEKSWGDARQLSLSGEAFFEVTEGSQFTVLTNTGTVRVLGTSFNVYNRDDEFHVHCFTGEVEVEMNQQKIKLTANQKAAIDAKNGRLVLAEFNPQKAATWRIGEFYFDAVEFTEVIDELERQFDIQITVNRDISDRFYSGFFSNNDLSEALQLVFEPMGLKSTVNGNNVTVE